MDMPGKVALVTGGAGGLGLGIVRTLLDNGCKVCFCDVNEDTGISTLTNLIQKYGEGNVVFKTCDVTSENQLNEVFKTTVDRFGKLVIVINNAGVLNEHSWENMLHINTMAMIRGTYLAFKYMDKNNGGNGGVVVNVSSVVGLHVLENTPVYGASKHAIRAFSQAIALSSVEMYGVRVNTICPGGIRTNMLRQVTDPELIPKHLYGANSVENAAKIVAEYPPIESDVMGKLVIPVIREGNGICRCIVPQGVADVPTIKELDHLDFKPLPTDL